MASIEEICKKIHQLILQLPKYTDPSQVPFENGLYFFFEDSETSAHGPAPHRRIVRVGDHPHTNNGLIKRLQLHYSGNKNCSVFRRYLGGALLRQDRKDACLAPSPGQGHWEKAKGKKCPDCQPYEDLVSEHISKKMSFRCISIPLKQNRNLWEKKLIATISLCSICSPTVDWLGIDAYSKKVKTSVLWNHQHVYDEQLVMNERDITDLERIVKATLGIVISPNSVVPHEIERRKTSMIPDKITREDILKVLDELKGQNIPEDRKSRKYCLEHEGSHYPPKYIISLAAALATGYELHSSQFNGGVETNSFLKSRGFPVVKCGFDCGGTKH